MLRTRLHVLFGIIIVATAAWILFERSGLSFLSICSDVLLTLVVVLFLRANYAVFRNKQLEALPELALSEEMVHDAATSFRVKINYLLLMAHDITLGKDFKLFFKVSMISRHEVVIALWLLSAIGSFVSFFTLAYIGTFVFVTFPALCNKYERHVNRFVGFIDRRFSNQFKIVNESAASRIPRKDSKDKDS